MKNNYELPIGEILSEQQVSPERGLAEDEVALRLARFGKNVFEKQKKQSLIVHILAQFKDVSVLILLAAALLSLALAIAEGTGFLEPIVVFAVIIMNTALAVTQEKSAENALEALSTLSAPVCRVLRGGSVRQISPEEVVPGDILVLKTGDFVPADARLVRTERFAVDESSLTGESLPAEKDAQALLSGDIPLGDRVNMVFSGCLVTAGNAVAVVTETGMRTQIGKIARFLTQTRAKKTTLQTRLDKVGRAVSGIALISAAALLVTGLLQGHDVWEMIMIAVTLAVAAVPETLSLIVTLILTRGAAKMAAKNALVRQMQAVETLGSTSVICSDKTGTLTMNRMALRRIWVRGAQAVSDGEAWTPTQEAFLQRLCLACTATVGRDETGAEKIYGDPTETAIVTLARARGMDYAATRARFACVMEIPFSSARKRMTRVMRLPEGGYLVLTKGAFDRLSLDRSDRQALEEAERVHDAFAGDALRVIALASKHIERLPESTEELETELTLEGFAGIIDPPRPEAKAAIARAGAAGIRTVMITGDHAATAGAIARELGIVTANEGIVTGQELAALSDEQLENVVAFYSVYARVSPEDKIRIVRAWQARGEVVAMTGDGVNDAPALKAADVGIAMGKNGTEVAKSAAKMVLTDDRFSTIVEAVAEGRNIFSNIRKLVYFLLVCNLSEIVVMLFAQFMGWGLPLTPLMLLIINVLGDGIPGMALAVEQSDGRIMNRRPIARTESFFGGGLMEVIIRQTFVMAAVSLAAFCLGRYAAIGAASEAAGRTMAFLVTGWTSALHVLTARSRKNIVRYRWRENPRLYVSCLGMLFLLGGIAGLAALPSVGSALGMCALGAKQWLVALALTVFPTLVAEYGKLWDEVRLRTAEKTAVR